jgi:hypothetical protein
LLGGGCFQPQPRSGLRLVDTVVGRQQCPHGVLVIADDRGGYLARRAEQLVMRDPSVTRPARSASEADR